MQSEMFDDNRCCHPWETPQHLMYLGYRGGVRLWQNNLEKKLLKLL
jgi:hypothetical protein